MAVDLEAIRRKVQELNGQNRNSSVQLWKPSVGVHKVRGLPWKKSEDGQPFLERFFYYFTNGPGILAPNQFGKEDPVQDLIRSLYKSGKPEDKEAAKKLHAKMRAYMPVIVRGQEDKGVQIWSFGKLIHKRLLSFYLGDEVEEAIGDILDPSTGFDLKVTITKQQGKDFNDTVVDPSRHSSKLHDDPAMVQKWLDAVPNLDDMYKLKSKQEIETALNNWLNAGPADVSTDGSSRGAVANDELEKLVNEVKAEANPKPAKAKAAKKSSDDDDAPAGNSKKDLDDAFNDLMKED